MPITALVADPGSEARARLTDLGSVRTLGLEELAPERLRALVSGADCAVIDAPPSHSLAAARRVHALDPAVQLIVVVPPGERAALERALLFSPGLGEVWMVAPEQLGGPLLERAGEVTRQRRRYPETQRRIRQNLSAMEPQQSERALISDAYLAALLQVLPDPVVSLDEEDRVLSWNPAAERLLGIPAAEAVGRSVRELLRAGEPTRLDRLLASGRRHLRREEITLRRRDGGVRTAEAAVIPVEAAGHRVRSMMLHDVTEARQAHEELESQAAQLEEQAAELELLNTELHERSLALEEAMEARSRFYAAMSHELRTPINAVIGYNSLLLDDIYGRMSPEQSAAVQRSQKAAEHLLELVNDVLDLAKIEAGRIDLEPEETRLPLLLEELLQTVRPLAQEHGVDLTLEGHPVEHVVRTDPRRVRQILLNLLSNAIKFGEGKPVLVSWTPLPDGGVRIEVTDRGSGIPPADLTRIFDEFVQIGGRERGGTGLGLPISRRLAELLGGGIGVVSTPGEGSTFRLILPPDLPPAPAG